MLVALTLGFWQKRSAADMMLKPSSSRSATIILLLLVLLIGLNEQRGAEGCWSLRCCCSQKRLVQFLR